jgi:chorismate mutase
MPKAKSPMTEEERSKRFKEEVERRIADGDFDQDAAENALDKLVKKSAAKQRSSHPRSS